jgi:hypothetical protein
VRSPYAARRSGFVTLSPPRHLQGGRSGSGGADSECELAGSPSVATRRESRLRVMMAASIAWCLRDAGQSISWCFCSYVTLPIPGRMQVSYTDLATWSVAQDLVKGSSFPAMTRVLLVKCRLEIPRRSQISSAINLQAERALAANRMKFRWRAAQSSARQSPPVCRDMSGNVTAAWCIAPITKLNRHTKSAGGSEG